MSFDAIATVLLGFVVIASDSGGLVGTAKSERRHTTCQTMAFWARRIARKNAGRVLPLSQ